MNPSEPIRYKVIIKPRALADLTEIHGYVSQSSVGSAASLTWSILDAFDGLDFFPGRYRVTDRRKDPNLSVRRMPIGNYLIYFRASDHLAIVEIMTVRHGARRQPKRFRP